MIGLLISLALVCLLMCVYLQRRNSALRRSMAKQNIEIPSDVDVNSSAEMEKFVQQKVEAANAQKEQSLNCATDPEQCQKH